MPNNFHEHLSGETVALPSNRSTGLVLTGALVVVAVLWRANPVVLTVALGLAGVLGGLSLVAPGLLTPVNRAWMGLAEVLSKVVSPIVMFVLFCITIVPFGLAMQMKRDPLRARPTEADETFWIVPEVSYGPNDMTRQF